MLHLAKCSHIKINYWDKVGDLMGRLKIKHGTTVRGWITGEKDEGGTLDEEGGGILFLAWRCLYAETVHARSSGTHLRLDHTYARLVLMMISRLKAQGVKWYRWYSRTRGQSPEKVKEFPRRYRKRKLLTTAYNAEYTINKSLLDEYDKIKKNRHIS